MQPIISAAQMREIDRLTTERYGVSSIMLMENAAKATARVVATLLGSQSADNRVLVLSGRGNNGGDGAATARLLTQGGAQVLLVLLAKHEDTKGNARINFESARALAATTPVTESENATASGRLEFIECSEVDDWQRIVTDKLSASPTVVVDAMFGTGLTRPLEGIYEVVVQYLSQLKPPTQIVSIDVPSGLNSDTADLIGPAVRADCTVTMTAPKPANILPPAANLNGKLVIANIGSPGDLIAAHSSGLNLTDEADARHWLEQTRYTPESYKNTHGHVLIVAGSRGFTGAAALCGNAAMRAGAGLVTVATPASVQSLVAGQLMPEVMTTALAETDRGAVSDDAANSVLNFSDRANVLALGPGLTSVDDRTRSFVRFVVKQRRTAVVVDADGLNCLAPWPVELRGSRELPIVLTPHPGEMARLLGREGERLADRVGAAREFATAHKVILVLKGTRSLVAAPDGNVFVNPTGNPGLGTAGAGDTLTGIIAGFLAQAYGIQKGETDPLAAVIAALYIGGLAGDFAAREIGMRAMVASDIREHLSAAIRSLDPQGERPLHDRHIS